MGTKQLPSITIIQNKLLDDKVNINAAQVKDAEKEYQEICKTTGRVPEVRAIEEMIESLERGQIKCAKAHAGRVQEAIIFYQKNLQKNAGDQYMNTNIMENIAKEKGYAQLQGSASRRTTPMVPPEPVTDYRTDEQYGHMSRADSRGMAQGAQRMNRQAERDTERQTLERLDKLSASKEASLRLRQDNPDLVDLNDKNRPTKLSERYTLLYDDKWTNAFEELQEIFQQTSERADEKAISCLLEILMNTFERNQRKSKEQLEDIETEINSIMLRVTLVQGATTPRGPDSVKADTSALKQYRKSIAALSIPELQKGFQDIYLPSILKNYGIGDQGKLRNVISYARSCVELTWLMCVQDPPMILDTPADRQYFDPDRFRSFTRHSRSVEFYVWPALMLHKNGPLLVKGVAQGK